MKARIDKVIERLFIREPALFAVICTHEIVENGKIRCPVRSGHGRIEYNPEFIHEMTDTALEESLKTEAIRILLKHPYERKPEGCCGAAIAAGSNLTIADNYPFARFRMESPDAYGFKSGMEYETYSRLLQKMSREDPLFDGNAYTDLSELWEEDSMMIEILDSLIKSTKDWGSLTGDMAEMILASTKAHIDWRKVLRGFRAQILSTERRLTRMRPNRRTGFDHMGSTRKYTTRLLVALDVSGSISNETISRFLSVINSAFRYGISEIEVIQFDTEVNGRQTLTRALKQTFAVGRGGTSFQAPVDFASENNFDGLVILTDGYAQEPLVPNGLRPRILWVCESEECYQEHASWMRKCGRACVMKQG